MTAHTTAKATSGSRSRETGRGNAVTPFVLATGRRIG